MSESNLLKQLIKDEKLNSKKLIKYEAAFDYIDKILIVLSSTSGGISIISLTSIVGAPVGNVTLVFSLTIGIIKKLLIITRKNRKKHYKILILAQDKLNSIEN